MKKYVIWFKMKKYVIWFKMTANLSSLLGRRGISLRLEPSSVSIPSTWRIAFQEKFSPSKMLLQTKRGSSTFINWLSIQSLMDRFIVSKFTNICNLLVLKLFVQKKRRKFLFNKHRQTFSFLKNNFSFCLCVHKKQEK
jgi:hypothetical protein